MITAAHQREVNRLPVFAPASAPPNAVLRTVTTEHRSTSGVLVDDRFAEVQRLDILFLASGADIENLYKY